MAEGISGTVWKKDASDSDEDVWDDRMLVEAYERASRKVVAALEDKRELAQTSSNLPSRSVQATKSGGDLKQTKQTVQKKKTTHVWKVGSYCRCTWSADGIEYEAQIMSMVDDNCLVRYLGYNNEEEHNLATLKNSHGNQRRLEQEQDAENTASVNETVESPPSGVPEPNSESQCSARKRIIAPPPPSFMGLPPSISTGSNEETPTEDESLASMLMSWYMSGYHTGYYRAMKQCKSQCTSGKGEAS